MQTITLAQRAKDFGDFYVPRFEVRVSGSALPESIVRDIISVTYKDSIKDVDSFEMSVGNWDAATRMFRYLEPGGKVTRAPSDEERVRYRMFQPGPRTLSLALGYGAKLVTMTAGDVSTLEPTFGQGDACTLTVRVLNVLHRLRDKQRSQRWQDKRISEVARSIKTLNDPATQKKLEVRINDAAKSKEKPIASIAQENQYDIDFLVQRAYTAGYVVYIGEERDKQGKLKEFLYFGPSEDRDGKPVEGVTYELEWGRSLNDFKPILSVAKQVKSVEVRSHDRAKGKQIKEKVEITDPAIAINKDLVDLLTQPGMQAREEVVVNEPQCTGEAGRERALSIIGDRLKEMATATGSCVGLPDLRAGRKLNIKGVGKLFSGTYFVTETTHTLNASGYITQFSARREQPSLGGAS
jgi:phage protein D